MAEQHDQEEPPTRLQQENGSHRRSQEPLPPCEVLFISGLPVAVPGSGWKRPLEKSFGKFSARGKPRVRIARNTFNNTVGHGWIENVLLSSAGDAATALDGELKIGAHPVSVSLCVDHRDALCPKICYAARKRLVLASTITGCSQPEPLEQPTAERIVELLMLFGKVGLAGAGDSVVSLPHVQLLDISTGEGLGTAVFASTFATVHAVESDAALFAALELNFSNSKTRDGETSMGSLATTSFADRIHLHRTLEDGISAASSGDPCLPLFSFFQGGTELVLEHADGSETKSGDCTQWAVNRFCTLLKAGCIVVAGLLPLSVDFEMVAAALVQPPTSPGSSVQSPTDERPHPFKVEFERPSYTAEQAPCAGLWQTWQLIIVTAALPSLLPPPVAATCATDMSFGNARLDALVGALLGFNGKYAKEHRPYFYDWEKQRTIQLSRWKGAKLASEHNGLTLKELRAAQSDPDPRPGSKEVATSANATQYPELATGGVGAVLSEPQFRQCRLVWVLIVNGGTCDRKAGTSRKASWVGFDKGYRSRRDALARCVTAALWANPSSVADGVASYTTTEQQAIDSGPPRLVHGDSECHIIHEQTGELLSISSEFAQTWRQGGPPTEARLLKAFDDAARDAGSAGGPGSTDKFVPGLTVHMDTKTVAEATARILEVSGLTTLLHRSVGTANEPVASRCAIVELHEDKERFLPVYTAPLLVEQVGRPEDAGASKDLPQLDALMMVLGCVQDHTEAVATVVETSLSDPALPNTLQSEDGDSLPDKDCRSVTRLHLAVNVGPVSEFSSKVIHLLQAYHSANRLLPAATKQLQLQLQEGTQTRPAKAQVARHERLEKLVAATVPHSMRDDVQLTPTPLATVVTRSHPKQLPLHFWVWCTGVRLAHLPTTEECKRTANPSLAAHHRSVVWRVPNVVLAAFARSHGAYDNVRLSLILEDVVITVDGTLITKHITARGWGALTEHHTLVALRDAIDAASPGAPVLAKSFEEAIRQAIHYQPGNVGGATGSSVRNMGRFVLLCNEPQNCGPMHNLGQRIYQGWPTDEHVIPPSIEATSSNTQQGRSCWSHFVLLPAAHQKSKDEIEREIRNAIGLQETPTCTTSQLHIAHCSTEAISPTSVAEPVRTIVTLQAHNNCGALAGAVDEIMEIQAAGASDWR